MESVLSFCCFPGFELGLTGLHDKTLSTELSRLPITIPPICTNDESFFFFLLYCMYVSGGCIGGENRAEWERRGIRIVK